MPQARRIGISMRVMCSEYGETRDALARDWPTLLERLGYVHNFPPEWFLLPNIGENCVSLARRFGIEGLLLTGGDDIGATPDRDATETALLHWASEEKLPVLGVCRGAQMLARHAGATLDEVQRERHVATRHAVAWRESELPASFWHQVLPGQGNAEVNSYHNWGLLPNSCPACLRTAAVCPEDGSIEAFCHAALPWLGIFWHPEREKTPSDMDMTLLYNLFAKA